MTDLSTYYKVNFPELFDAKCIVAVSGGLDSTVLFRSLVDAGVDVVTAHVNYNLRGEESDGDEAFVRALCKELETPLHVKTIDLKKGSGLQERARRVRYEWFREVATETNGDLILTGHHSDDQVETVYFHLMRGSGMDSLAGIPLRRDNVLRPLLGLSRDELRAYAEERGWQWREDRSNASNDYMRNKIRNEILPVLEEEVPGIRSEILELGMLAGRITEENQRNFEEFSIDHIEVDGNRERLTYDAWEVGYDREDILYRWLTPKGFTVGTIRRIGESGDASTGAQFPGPEGRLIKDREEFVYRHGKPEEVDITIDRGDEEVKTSGVTLRFEDVDVPQEFNNDRSEILVDSNKLDWPLRIRNWRKGDRIRVLGMQGTKKVSDILIDDKVSSAGKGDVLVLESGGEIVWLIGLRQSDVHRIEPESEAAVRIKFFI